MWFTNCFEKATVFLTKRLTRCRRMQFTPSMRLVFPDFFLLQNALLEGWPPYRLPIHPYKHHIQIGKAPALLPKMLLHLPQTALLSEWLQPGESEHPGPTRSILGSSFSLQMTTFHRLQDVLELDQKNLAVLVPLNLWWCNNG